MSKLNTLAKEINSINESNGWNVMQPTDFAQDPEIIATSLCLIHSEVSEALEALRNEDFSNFSEELADTLIRVLDTAGQLGVDMDAEVRRKLDKNKGRGYRHGGKRI